jgi:transposase
MKATPNLIEIYYNGNRICSHNRNGKAYGYTTVTEHMPKSHQKYLEWTPDRILYYAGKYGQAVQALIQKVMATRKFPEQAYKSCLGIIRLENKYSAERLNLACLRALEYRAYSYKSVVNILQKGLDKQTMPTSSNTVLINHENIRGSNYYSEGAQ